MHDNTTVSDIGFGLCSLIETTCVNRQCTMIIHVHLATTRQSKNNIKNHKTI